MEPEALTSAVYKAIEDHIFRKVKPRDILDLDIRVSFEIETQTVNIEVFLDAEDWIEAEEIVEGAILAGMQLADKLMEHERILQ
ncbi:MAG: DUF3194 domain-containing protein [Halobacteria archaeon]